MIRAMRQVRFSANGSLAEVGKAPSTQTVLEENDACLKRSIGLLFEF